MDITQEASQAEMESGVGALIQPRSARSKYPPIDDGGASAPSSVVGAGVTVLAMIYC